MIDLAEELRRSMKRQGLKPPAKPYRREPRLYVREASDGAPPPPRYNRNIGKQHRECAGCGGEVWTTKAPDQDAFCRNCRKEGKHSTPPECAGCGKPLVRRPGGGTTRCADCRSARAA